MNSGPWTRDEKDKLDQSLMENGNATSYEYIMKFVTTRKKSLLCHIILKIKWIFYVGEK